MMYGPTPLLVSSIGRSGSTLLMSHLGRSPEIFLPRYYPFERRYLSYFCHFANLFIDDAPADDWSYKSLFQTSLKSVGPFPFLDRDALDFARKTRKELGLEVLKGLTASIMSQLHPEFFSAKFWAEKGTEQIGLLDKLGVGERVVIYLIRDPRDLFLSHLSFSKISSDSEEFNLRVSEYKAWISSYLEFGVSDGRNILVKYENLVLQPEEELSRLARLLDVSFVAPQLSIPGGHVTSSSPVDSVERWKRHPDSQLVRRLQELFADEIKALGYEFDGRGQEISGSPPDLHVGEISEDEVAVVGHDSWLFIKKGSNNWTEFAQQTFVQSDTLVSGWAKLIQQRKNQLLDRGILYKVLLSPEKDVLYPEYSPSEVPSPFRLAVTLKDMLPEVIYPVEEMLDEKKVSLTYKPLDSHWNFHGGYIAYRSVMISLGLEYVPAISLKVKRKECINDLPLHFGRSIYTDEQCLDYDSIEEEILVKVEAPHFRGMRLRLTNCSAKYDKTLMVFGDSYSWNVDGGLIRFLALSFSTVLFVWDQRLDFSLIDETSPDIVLTEIAERFLITLPES